MPSQHGGPLTPATVRWDGRQLLIEAANVSLREILRQAAALTGARLEGELGPLGAQSVFGRYGPGPGCDVLAELLRGTGVNVAMTGAPGSDAPLVLVLSARPSAEALAVRYRRDRLREAQEQHDAPPPRPELPRDDIAASAPAPPQNPYANGAKTGDASQFMDEILHRQEKIDQQAEAAESKAQP